MSGSTQEEVMTEFATEFTPVAATIGGVLIGLAATRMLLFDGRYIFFRP